MLPGVGPALLHQGVVVAIPKGIGTQGVCTMVPLAYWWYDASTHEQNEPDQEQPSQHASACAPFAVMGEEGGAALKLHRYSADQAYPAEWCQGKGQRRRE